MNRIAIITARGGSKRIPRKNIKMFCGKPIITYSIEAALQSGAFDRVMVSTDDPEIAQVALEAGAEVPFMRSAENSNDYAATADVLLEVLNSYAEVGVDVDQFCCIYPTAPFVTAEKLSEGMKHLAENDVDTVLPVVQYSFPPQRSFSIVEDRIKMNMPNKFLCRSQDLPPIYHDCGQFYCAKTEPFKKYKLLVTPNTMPIIMPETEVQDIDTEDDWIIAEMKYKMMQERIRS